MSQRKYVVFRTIRSTMAATGERFAVARSIRRAALARSERGRTMLAREAHRRELARQRREVKRNAPSPTKPPWMVDGLPAPRFDKDYGPNTPYAVIVKLTYQKDVVGIGGRITSETDIRYITLTFRTVPTQEMIQHELTPLWEENMNDSGPLGESDVDTDWYLIDTNVVGYQVSLNRIGGAS